MNKKSRNADNIRQVKQLFNAANYRCAHNMRGSNGDMEFFVGAGSVPLLALQYYKNDDGFELWAPMAQFNRMDRTLEALQKALSPSPTKPCSFDIVKTTQTSFVCKASVEAACGCRCVAFSGDKPPFAPEIPPLRVPCDMGSHSLKNPEHWDPLERSASFTAQSFKQQFFERLHGETALPAKAR